MSYFAGLDFGTSGARIIVIDDELNPVYERAVVYGSEGDRRNPHRWLHSLWDLLTHLPVDIKGPLKRIAVDGTSSTVLICNQQGEPITSPKMYNESCSDVALLKLRDVAPKQHIVQSSTSSFAKLLDWAMDDVLTEASFFVHQADWLSAHLHGDWTRSDFHNSLKLGFDPVALSYPDWFQALLGDFCGLLPSPVKPGQIVGHLLETVAQKLGLPKEVEVCAGTTDSIAAFLASDAQKIGDAVTSLGSTLALKLLSQNRVDSPAFGVYSHWFGQKWLVGGASNAGGAILSHFFNPQDLVRLSSLIDWSTPPLYQYVPLLRPGERFPINDPSLEPCLSPRPHDPVEFLKGLLASLTQIEVEGYRKLQALGASGLRQVFSAGGGAHNSSWQTLRQQKLGIPVSVSQNPQAAYGTAKLAWGCLAQIH